jgi:hypothetical protein
MNANATSPIHGACQICAAGRMAMNAIEMPASEPSIAAAASTAGSTAHQRAALARSHR